MNTFGYIREATIAHLDIDEQEVQAMNLQERYHIFANEAMQTICGVKPKYDYFKCKIVKKYDPVINLGDNNFRKATYEEIYQRDTGFSQLSFADEVDTRRWYESQNIYLLNEQIYLKDDFIAFAEKQAYIIHEKLKFNPEVFVNEWGPSSYYMGQRHKATKEDFSYMGRNSLAFHTEGEFFIPYKGIWFKFKSGMSDEETIDMPVDIFLTIPIFIAALCLEQDNVQKAAIKRAQFERALANCTATDFLDLKSVTPTFI